VAPLDIDPNGDKAKEVTVTVNYIRPGHRTVTPYLVVSGLAGLVQFLQQAFEAEETDRTMRPDGTIMHSEVRIGDSMIMMGEATPGSRNWPAMIHLYVPDADAAYRQALEAGATSVQEPVDEFYGDRTAAVEDRFGNQWWIATYREQVPPEELARRQEPRARP
jgi:PhnB protein